MAVARAVIDPTPAPVAGKVAPPVSLESVGRLLRGLNREQRRAVTHRGGPQLVIAGPGTGKTEVVTRRVAWLIATGRARPREILALTFTDAAAQEMQARVDVLVPYGQADADILTFHALGDRLIRQYAFELGLPGDVRLVNRPEAILLMRDNLFSLGLDRYLPLGDPTRFLGALVDLFGRARDECVTPQSFAAHAQELADQATAAADADESAVLADLSGARTEVASAYAAYDRLLRERGLIDHGDQIGLALRLLRDRPAVRADVVSRYRHILVDELQDTNPAQLELVLALTGADSNITVVGDPDQAIYTFRGAAVGNVHRFVASHPDLRCTVLRRNYRSHAPILAAADRLIAHNRAGTGEGSALPSVELSRPVAHRRSRAPSPVGRLSFGTPDEEADGVAERIRERIAGGARPSEFAVLVRTNDDADAFVRSLAVRGIPARMGAPAHLLAQPTVRGLLAYLRVVADPHDSAELYLLAADEPYRVSGAELAELLGQARRSHVSLWQHMTGVRTDAASSVGRLVADVRAGLEAASSRTSGEVLYGHLKRTGRLAQLAAADRDGQDATVLSSVVRFFNLVRTRASLLATDRVSFLVPHLAALAEAGANDRDAGPLDDDVVSVLTVHRAKGLQFRYVYLCGLVDGRFPGHARPPALSVPAELLALRGAPEEDPLAEERRLAYVAMTRARDELWLSHHRAGPAGKGRRRPSPFLAEALDLPASEIDQAIDTLNLPTPPASDFLPVMHHDGRATPERLTLSYSQLDDYLTCPERYRLRHVAGVPSPAHHALAYGTALHQAVGAYHLRRSHGETMTEADLIEVFRGAWSPEGFLSREHEEARFAEGCAALGRFHSRMAASADETVAIERPFSFEVGRDTVRGRMDRVDRTDQGAVIVDYKSSNVPDQKRADARARDSLQLQVYALAYQAETGQLPAEVQLHFLDSDTVGRATPDAERLTKARDKVANAASAIRAGHFEPKPNPIACGYCPFRTICPSSAA